ncbi:MAG: hypothetical protein ACXVZ4_14250 [Gaiellaceae bacterium]
MSGQTVHGVVSAEQWQQIAEQDNARRATHTDGDFPSSVLTALAGILTLAMLAVGPMWTIIAVVGGEGEHGPAFDRLWLLPLAFTFAAAVPLGWAIHRERSRARWTLVGFLVASLAIQLATCPWL